MIDQRADGDKCRWSIAKRLVGGDVYLEVDLATTQMGDLVERLKEFELAGEKIQGKYMRNS